MNRLSCAALAPPALLAVAALLAPGRARAALTSSEQAQIVSYVNEGRLPTAGRVRALVARPDLTADESAQALQAAIAPLAWTDARAAYVHELMYGESSLPSRGVLAVAVTRALAARADAILSRHEADLDQDAASVAELTRLFAFIDSDVANAGHPRGPAHDPSIGIGAQSYDDAAKALTGVIERHARWLKGDAAIPASAEPVRAQLQLALLDMTNDTTTRRFDAADRLWLTGARRAPLTESGMLLLDDGHTDPGLIAAVRGVLARLPGGREDAEAVALTPMTAPLRARGQILTWREGGPPPATAPFGEEVSAPPFPPEVVGIARALATVTVRHALDIRPELHAQADQDTAAAGDPNALVTMVTLLALDAPRAMDLALVRGIAGHAESLALLSDALGVLAVFTPPTPGGMAIALGRSAEAGGPSTISATNVRLAPAGFATSFTLAGHAWSITREAGKAKATRDGQAATLAMLEHARAPVTPGPVWSSGSVFAKMSGSPRAGVSSDLQAGVHVRLVGDGAIATPAPGDDTVVTATVDVTGETAVVLRAISTVTAFKGVGLVLDTTTGKLRASLRSWEGAKTAELGPPVDVPCTSKCRVEVHAKKNFLGATVEGIEIPAVLIPPPFAHGDVALYAKGGAAIEASAWSVTKPGPHDVK